MKKNRIIYGIVWILSLVLISFYGGAASFGIFTMVTLIPLISIIYIVCVGVTFSIYQEKGTNVVTAGEVVPFHFSLMNEHRFGFAGLRVLFFADFSTIDRLEDGMEFELLPFTGIERQTNLVCKYRGEYEVGIRAVEISDYLQLFKWTWRNKETLRVTVRPDLVTLNDTSTLDLMYLVARESREEGSEPDLLFRDYQPGDDIRQIHWKALAKTGKLSVRKRINERQEGAGILFGTFRKSEDPKKYLPVENKILELVLALSYYLVGRFIPVRALYMQDNGIMDEGVSFIGQFEEYYTAMSNVRFSDKTSEDELLEQFMYAPALGELGMCFIILQEMTAQAEEFVKSMSLRQIQCVVYLVGGAGEDMDQDKAFQKTTGIGQTPVFIVGTEAKLGEGGGDLLR